MSKYELLVHGDEAEYAEITPRLRLRKYGSWLISEKKKQSKLAKERARQLLSVLNLSKKISADKGITVDEAFALINNAGGDSSLNITAEYADEVAQVVESSMGDEDGDSRILTMFLSSRAQGLIDGQWVRLADWSPDDTDVLDDKTREKIVAFINEEQAGGSKVEDDDDEEEAVEGAEGNEKKPATSGKKSKSTASESSNNETTGTDAMQESPLVV